MNRQLDAEERSALERREEELRDRLLETVSVVDRRRHDVLDWRLQLRRRGPILAMAGGAIAAASVVAFLLRRRTAGKRRKKARVQALQRIWKHPERIAQRERSSVWADVAHRLTVALLSAVLIAPLERGVKRLVERT